MSACTPKSACPDISPSLIDYSLRVTNTMNTLVADGNKNNAITRLDILSAEIQLNIQRQQALQNQQKTRRRY